MSDTRFVDSQADLHHFLLCISLMTLESTNQEFTSWRNYWNFARVVSREYRFIRPPLIEAFLKTVRLTSESRREQIPAGSIFWRAQAGHAWRPIGNGIDDEMPCAHPTSRMKPLLDRASDGRANPRGIPCLYLATTKEAAMSEVRPWIGSYVSAGQFKTIRPLTVINCARRYNQSPFFMRLDDFNYEPPADERSEAVWTHIDQAFAKPMTRTDDQADYAPTQILAELFKESGADGVVYKSNFGNEGFNIALFDPNDAKLTCCGLFKVKGVQMTFSEEDEFYYVREQATDNAS